MYLRVCWSEAHSPCLFRLEKIVEGSGEAWEAVLPAESARPVVEAFAAEVTRTPDNDDGEILKKRENIEVSLRLR